MSTNIKFNKRLYTLIVIMSVSFTSFSQKNFSLYHLQQTNQANYLNPGFKQNNRLYLSLPVGMQNISLMNSGFTLNSALESRSQDDSLQISPSLLLTDMKNLNYVNFEMSNEIFGLGFKVKENFISLNITNRFQTRLNYPKDLLELSLDGNGNKLLGERASLDGIGLNLSSYIEYGIGFNRNINEKLTIGGRVKLISGVANINTIDTKLGLTTDASTFALTIDGSSEINTSNISPFTDSTIEYNPFPSLFNFSNIGFGIDLGANYEYNDNLSFSASILDLGLIKWKDNVTNYVSNDVNYTFEGIDLNQALDSVNNIGSDLSDTLQEIFRQDENNNSYNTALRTKFYLGGRYKFNDVFSSSVLVYNEIIGQKYNVGTSISGNIQLKRWLGFSLNYSTYGKSFNNLGLGINLVAGPVQFYGMTDNVMAVISPTSSKHAHVSFGMNIVIGPKKDKEGKEKSSNPKPKKSKVKKDDKKEIETVDPVQTQEK